MIRLITRFFDDIHRIANCLAFPRAQDVLVSFSQDATDQIVEAATNYRRNKPRAKKLTDPTFLPERTEYEG
jgi:hypothetical protein